MRVAGHADVSGDGAVLARPGQLVAVLLSADSGAAATLTLYDNASAASGTVLAQLTALQGDSVAFCPAASIACANGIFADIGGASANATVVFI